MNDFLDLEYSIKKNKEKVPTGVMLSWGLPLLVGVPPTLRTELGTTRCSSTKEGEDNLSACLYEAIHNFCIQGFYMGCTYWGAPPGGPAL